ncbi:formimidoylglutamase [Moraxella caviae]|uniref:Formimidoylglutamase n=1 Tax=Moraxella caviae TaxID=34060 RepID=A0A1T0A843_9GAMM|nr:formimidoylglutamase [Moraxella caviae]OOR91902.1 formimidoylglutamase [Moraxella caviae]STZ09756.1 Formimidoylglutamase [Moraxella caviae]
MQYTKITPHNPTLWTARQEPFESARACYWQEIVSSGEALANQNLSAKIALLGFCCDQGVLRNQGRIGAKHAPDKIKSAFAKLPVPSAVLDAFGDNRQALSKLVADMGNVHCVDNDEMLANALENTQTVFAQKIKNYLNNNSLPIGLGGGHEIAYASFLGLYQHLQDKASQAPSKQTHLPKIGIINFDAHLDLRQNDVASSGTPFRQISELVGAEHFHYLCVGVSRFSNAAALFDRAASLNVSMISDDDCNRLAFDEIAKRLHTFCDALDVLYITLDMDGFSSSLVPAVSAPAAKGFSLDFAEQCLDLLFATGKVKVVDFAEINPKYDTDDKSVKVAARLLAGVIERHLLHGFGA